MSSLTLGIKLIACASLVCGLTYAPLNYKISEKENITPEKTFEVPRGPAVKKPLKIGQSSKGDYSLNLNNVNNINQLLSGTKKQLSFKELGMKWGERELSSEDILYQLCDEYYLLKKERSGYQFEDGTSRKSCNDVRGKNALKSVNLSWTKYTRGSAKLPQITVGSCSLDRVPNEKEANKFKLQISCYQYPNRGGEKVVGEFRDSIFE